MPSVLIETFTRYDEAFYDSFRLMSLDRLSKEQCLSFAISITENAKKCSDIILEVLDIVPRTPRSVLQITNVLIIGRRSREEIIAGIVDDMTMYYESLLSRQVPMSRDILITLLHNGPCNLPQLRKILNVESGTISAYLQMLIGKGLVVKTSTKARKSIYSAMDSLMVEWSKKALCRERFLAVGGINEYSD